MDYNWDQQEAAAQRARQLATQLRRGLNATPNMPQGQMVGGQYIAPSWTQNLNAAIAPVVSGLSVAHQENAANQAEDQYAGNVAQARQQWQQSLPQTIAGRAAVPGNNPSAFEPATPDQPPTREATLKATIAGLAIPGNKDAATAYNKGMSEQQTREDVQAARKDDQRAAAEDRRANLLMTLAQRAEEARIRAETSRENSKERADAMREAAAARAEFQREMLASRRDHQAAVMDQKTREDVQRNLNILSTKATPLVPLVTGAARVQEVLDKYQEAGKKVPGLGHAGFIPDFLQGPEATQNRAAVAAFAQSLIQSQAGLSQTLSEQELTKATALTKATFSEKDFKDNWPWMVKKVNDTVKNIKAAHSVPLSEGTPSVWDTYTQQGGTLREIGSRIKDAPKAVVTIGADKVRSLPATLGTPRSQTKDRDLTPAEQAEYDERMARLRSK